MILHCTISKQSYLLIPRTTFKQPLFNASQHSLTHYAKSRLFLAPLTRTQPSTSIPSRTRIQSLTSTPKFNMTDPLPKRQKTSPVLIGTHSGHFHADEALAVWFLRQLPTYSNSTLVRTRDPAVLDTCHTVVDVGGEYNHDKNRYGHTKYSISLHDRYRSTSGNCELRIAGNEAISILRRGFCISFDYHVHILTVP